MALPKKQGAKSVDKTDRLVNFGDMGVYVAGGGLPEGNYAFEFAVQMYQATNQQGVAKGPSRLGVMVTAHSLTDPSAEPKTQFYSMGSKAHESFMPDPDTGKSLVAVAGGPGVSTFNNQTNWAFLLKSLYDCGLPNGVFTNDLSVLDGIWVHVTNIPEPEERKGFMASRTSEVAEEPRRSGTIAIVSEILPDGEPWAGGGGVPEKTEVPATKAPPKVVGKAASKTAPKAAPTPAPTEGLSEEDLMEAAEAGVTAVLEKSPDGTSRLALRTGTFKAVVDAYGDDVAQAVLETFFGSDEGIESVVSSLGYTLKGTKVVPK